MCADGPKRDAFDVFNLFILIGAFLAAVAAAIHAGSLADLTKTAIDETRAVTKQQAIDTQRSLEITGKAAAAAQEAADAAQIQALALRGNLGFLGIKITEQLGPPKSPPEKAELAGWIMNPSWKNVGQTDVRNFFGWWALGPVQIPNPMPIEQSTQLTCPTPPSKYPPANPITVAPGDSEILAAQFLPMRTARAAFGPLAKVLIYAIGHVEYHDIFPGTPLHTIDWCIIEFPNDLEKGTFSPFDVYKKTSD